MTLIITYIDNDKNDDNVNNNSIKMTTKMVAC